MDSTHLKEVVDSYNLLETPSYAIMINGAWGSGKTHFIKDYFHSSSLKMLYVSLYGVSSLSQIEDEIFSSIVGAEGISDGEIKKAGEFFGKMASSFGGMTEGTAIGAFASTLGSSIKTRTVKSIGAKSVLVFDDLERASLEPSKCLSKINDFVEHLGVKVIILSDETKIKDSVYWDYKEKVILYTNHLERKPCEIVDICFNQIQNFPPIHTFTAKQELHHLIKQFGLTNIRTVKHAFNCFSEVINKLYQMEFQYKDDKIICDLLFPCIAFSVGYRDMQVPIGELEKTAVSSHDLSMSYRMKADARKENNKGEQPSTWETFYTRLLGKSNKQVEFNSIFTLVCKGHLDEQLINKDIERWNIQEHGAEYPITNFRIDVDNDEDEFQRDIENALKLLDEDNHIFQSTESLFAFCCCFYYLHKRCAFDYEGDFANKLNSFANNVVEKCINHVEISLFNISDREDKFVDSLFEVLSERSSKLRKAQRVIEAQSELSSALKKSNKTAINNIANQPTVPLFDTKYSKKLLSEIKSMNPSNLRILCGFFKERYNSINIFDFLPSEIEPLIQLEIELIKLREKTANSLQKYMLIILTDIISEIAQKAKEAIKHQIKET